MFVLIFIITEAHGMHMEFRRQILGVTSLLPSFMWALRIEPQAPLLVRPSQKPFLCNFLSLLVFFFFKAGSHNISQAALEFAV